MDKAFFSLLKSTDVKLQVSATDEAIKIQFQDKKSGRPYFRGSREIVMRRCNKCQKDIMGKLCGLIYQKEKL